MFLKTQHYHEEIVSKTMELINIKSVEAPSSGPYPFGEGPAKALDYVLKLGESLGFKVKNLDHYAGHVEMGEGDDILGILGHVDVVPAGSDWSSPPYKAEIRDGKLFGRGVLDDKGPIIAGLYAMKAVADSNMLIDKRVRLIIGTNEETGWGGIKHYLSKEEAPTFALTPDADFPIIHGEKGMMNVLIRKAFEQNSECTSKPLLIEGGTAINMVPDSCTFEMDMSSENEHEIQNLIKKMMGTEGEYEYQYINSQLQIKAVGKAAHGSTPENGENAISKLMCMLQDFLFDNLALKNLIEFYNLYIGMEYNGEKMGMGLCDDVSGKLTCNVGLIRVDKQQIEMKLDIRYPLTYSYEDVIEPLKARASRMGFDIQVNKHKESIFIPENHGFIQKLMQVYQEVTGDYASKPLVIGGGTYARALKHAVAFGPLFPGRVDTAHQKDEHMLIEDLLKCSEIYAQAIESLLSL